VRRFQARPAEHEPGHSRWLVSYSDFITLLFAFFVVLFASSYRNNRAIPAVSRAIHSGFQEMGIASPAQSEVTPKAPKTPPPASAGSTADMLELQRQLEAALSKELRNHQVVLHLTPEGFVISLNEVGFFDSGKATLLPGAAEKISRIAGVLSRNGLSLRIEGHSDNQPIHNDQFHSNWELSTARAIAVLSWLANDTAFPPAKLSVAGYGEYRPVASNATPEGRKLNRRVDLVVVAAVHQQ
jgi:chemotaxis protein MotB